MQRLQRASRHHRELARDALRHSDKYKDMEDRINAILPEPLWMRKMGEVQEKGFKFQRRG